MLQSTMCLRALRRTSCLPATSQFSKPTLRCISTLLGDRPSGLLKNTKAGHLRYFHPTPSCRFLESYIDGPLMPFVAAIGITAAVIFKTYYPKILTHEEISEKLTPPASWFENADPSTVRSVLATVSMGFNMAQSKSGKEKQHMALGEATFHVPYELSRLNHGDFRLKDMGPIPPFPEEWQEMMEAKAMLAPFDAETDSRVYLYFPKGQSNATVLFVAVNAAIGIPNPQENTAIHDLDESSGEALQKLINHSKLGVVNQWQVWKQDSPDILDHIETEESRYLPVIFCFRDKVLTLSLDVETGEFQSETIAGIIGLVQKET